jgi:4-hydroxybenzoate polyprenyltransferase
MARGRPAQPFTPAALRMARPSIPEIIEPAGPVRAAASPGSRSLVLNLLVSLRPSQWTKNLIIFGPLGLGLKLTEMRAVLDALAAFVIFCLLSGVVYLINDVVDRHADRLHPLKRHRPIASGAVPVRVALGLASVLGAIAISAAFWLRPLFGVLALSYVGLLALYSGRGPWRWTSLWAPGCTC